MLLWFWFLCSSTPCHPSFGPVDEAFSIDFLVPARIFHRLLVIFVKVILFFFLKCIFFEHPCCRSSSSDPSILFALFL
ncbi:hypothetical protein BDA99DRAFT_509413, partial [Phascolomyces articulosus]